jgi:hypothetical protein
VPLGDTLGWELGIPLETELGLSLGAIPVASLGESANGSSARSQSDARVRLHIADHE